MCFLLCLSLIRLNALLGVETLRFDGRFLYSVLMSDGQSVVLNVKRQMQCTIKTWQCAEIEKKRLTVMKCRADNLVLVKFGFSAVSVPRFFRRLVLDLVLKTSNSAHLVLLKSNEHYAKWWSWARPHVQIHSIERSGQICNIWRGCNNKSVARYDHQVVDRQKHACSFCAVSEPCRSTEMSPWLAGIISVDFDSEVALRTQVPVFHSKLRIFRVSADDVSE